LGLLSIFRDARIFCSVRSSIFFIHDGAFSNIVCPRCLRRLLPTFEIYVPTGWPCFLVIAGATDYVMSVVVILGHGYVAQ
jgi:hypothetical protein